MEDVIVKHVLLNATEHDGKASAQAVLGKVLAEKPELKTKIKDVMAEINKSIAEINAVPVEEQKKMLGKFDVVIKKPEKEHGLPDLDGAEKGNVVMRLAPYPSGPLHIGNARMVLLNDEYVKRYGGKLYLAYDDTIGSEEKPIVPQSYAMIKDSLDWLGVKVDKIFHKSDRLEIFYKHAEEFIKKGFAYVCLCDAVTLRKFREEGTACQHRDTPSEQNLELWKKMLKGQFKEGGAVVRIKTDMKHPNPAFRDRVLFRVAEREHPRVEKKYMVWPMLEFSWAIDDHLLGITHILRGKDLIIEDEMEQFIWDRMGWPKARFVHYGILNIEEAKLSKTQSRMNIEKGVYSGWDDPRTWSMQSLKKRGIQPEAIRKFIISMGLSLADVTIPAEILYSENRKIIDPVANRYFAVVDPVSVKVEGSQNIKEAEAPLHPDFPERGKRKIPVDINNIRIEKKDLENLSGREARLMDLFNARIEKDRLAVTGKELKMDMPKIHWVSEPSVKIKIMMPDGTVKDALAEPSIKHAKENDLIQLIRIGFCRVDKTGKEITLCFAHK